MSRTPAPPAFSGYAYVGSRTTRERHARGEGLGVFGMTADGGLEHLQTLDGLVNPSYLVLSSAGTHLYAVHGDAHDVSAFAVDGASGRLHALNQQHTQGENPVHLALTPDESALIVCNHATGTLALLPLGAHGALQAATQVVELSGPLGPHRSEQTHAKPHFCLFSPDGRFLYVPDKGLDRIFAFRLERRRLVPAGMPFTPTREGAGPRHMVFHPAQPLAYVVNELDSTVTSYQYLAESGTLRALQILSTLPASFTGNSRAAAIAVDSSGRTLYASNRGHDSIAVFHLDPTTGLPDFRQAVPTGGRTPRSFTLSPDGRTLYALNEDSDTIVRFSVDPHTGGLARTGDATRTGSPVCLVCASRQPRPG